MKFQETVRLEEDQHRAVRNMAEDENLPIAEIVRRLVDIGLSEIMRPNQIEYQNLLRNHFSEITLDTLDELYTRNLDDELEKAISQVKEAVLEWKDDRTRSIER